MADAEESPQIRKFIENSAVYPPMDIFEEVNKPSNEAARDIIEKCRKLFEKKRNTEPNEFFGWFSKVIDNIHPKLALVIFGKMAYGNGAEDGVPSDFDFFIFTKGERATIHESNIGDLLSWNQKPRLVQPQVLYHNGRLIDGISGWKRACVANTLILFPGDADGFVYEIIEEGRKLIANSPFFEGGIGDIITYAVYKVMEGNEEKYFKTDEERKVLSKKLIVWEQYMDGMPAPPHEVYKNIRSELRSKLDDKEMTSVALAAMRRIKVKREKRRELADKFVRKIRNC